MTVHTHSAGLLYFRFKPKAIIVRTTKPILKYKCCCQLIFSKIPPQEQGRFLLVLSSKATYPVKMTIKTKLPISPIILVLR